MIVHKLTNSFRVVALRRQLWGATSYQKCTLLSSASAFTHHVFPSSQSPSLILHRLDYNNDTLAQRLAFSTSTTLSSASSPTEEDSEKEDSLPLATVGEDAEADYSDSDSETSDAESSSSQSNREQRLNWPPNAEQIKEITGGDPELEKKIQFILMEHNLLREEGVRAPSSILKKNWPELLSLSSKAQRIKYYSYLWKTEMKQASHGRKKIALQQKRAEEFQKLPPRPLVEEDEYRMTYGLCRNTIFLRLYESRVASAQFHRVISEMVLGTPLVIDCGYDDEMVFREAKNCASQLEYLLTDNRVHPQPFNLVFCNANPNSATMTQLVKRIPTLYDDHYALDIRQASYLDIFPREKLVYLSPHARDELTTFDDDEIYIIGAIVDKSDPRPFSMAKAKKEGIRLKKLPLDSQTDWGIGSKSLTLNQLVKIMLEIRVTRDWEKAFRFVPRRKLVGGRTECPPRVLTDYAAMAKRRERRPYHMNDRDDELVDSRRGGIRLYAKDDQLFDRRNEGGHRFQGKQKEFDKGNPRVKTILSDY